MHTEEGGPPPATKPQYPAPAPTGTTRGAWSGPTVKFFVVAFLVGLLVVPLLVVWALNAEREGRKQAVSAAIAADWGGAQVVRGPFLVVPWRATRLETQGERTVPVVVEGALVVQPDTLTADVDAKTSVRTVSIYDTPVYNAKLALQARFPALERTDAVPPDAVLDWSRARVGVVVPYVQGIEEARIVAGGTDLTAEPTAGLPPMDGYSYMSNDGVHAALPAATVAGAPLEVAVTLRVRGSGSLGIHPVGRESTITLAADWPHPGFPGWRLPSEREATDAGFRAVWRVPYLARTTPQFMPAERFLQMADQGQPAGVSLTDPVDAYALLDRALKYGVMFVAAIFYVVFFLEVLSARRIHVVQYCIVGMIAVFFYVLLLALSERVAFLPAYLTASAATGGVIATFVGVALASRIRAAIAAVAFAALFGLLFAILRLEDVALLAGAVTGFVVLTIGLFASRRVDWSGRAGAEPTGAAKAAAT
jgi:inner membrane protein